MTALTPAWPWLGPTRRRSSSSRPSGFPGTPPAWTRAGCWPTAQWNVGVARERIHVTRRVSNTADEASAVSDALTARGRSHAPASVILVTSAFHMRRSALLFTRAGLFVTPFPVDFRTSLEPRSFGQLLPQAGSLSNTEIALREFYGYLYYRIVKG